MKSILIIGLGRFGTHLCQDLARLDNEIMIVDKDEASLEDLLPLVVSAKIGDCTNEKVLKSLGVGNFDYCFVCIVKIISEFHIVKDLICRKTDCNFFCNITVWINNFVRAVAQQEL